MRPGRAADHSPSSSDAVMEEYSYTSTHPLATPGLKRDTLIFNGDCVFVTLQFHCYIKNSGLILNYRTFIVVVTMLL